MNNTEISEKVTGAENVIWDLSDLYASSTDEQFVSDLNSIESKCISFHDQWHGTLNTIGIQSSVEMMLQYEQLVETIDRLSSYAQLVWSTNTEDPANGKLLQSTRETIARASQHLIFLSIELMNLSDDRFNALMNAGEMASRKHWFEGLLDIKPHRLSEEVERALSLKSLTSRFAWVRLHDEIMSAQVFKLNGKEYTEAEVMKLLQESNRDTRKAAAESVSEGLKEVVKQQAYIFNTVVADQAAEDMMRRYPTWISYRNQMNEASDASVNALIEAVVKRSDLLQRYYALKKQLLGVDTLYEYDRNAPIGNDNTFWTWDAAKDIVISAYTEFHPEMGRIAQMFFDQSWIHAPVSKGKNGGAYSAGTIASAHPYVFLNYMGSNRDVQVLAHELGHGVHQYLSRQQGPLLMDTPLTIAETASVFGEIITFNKLFESATTNQQKLSMLMGKIDDIVSTVFRQIMLNRFEDALHVTRKAEGELSVDRICELWMETQSAMYGDSIHLNDGYKYWWSYISHFMHVPGYVYAYAYGELLVLALHEIYKSDKEGFPSKYFELLSSGGSKKPTDLLKPFNIDVEDPSFWNIGLTVFERLVVEAESLAKTV